MKVSRSPSSVSVLNLSLRDGLFHPLFAVRHFREDARQREVRLETSHLIKRQGAGYSESSSSSSLSLELRIQC